jgi:hypothetical protein
MDLQTCQKIWDEIANLHFEFITTYTRDTYIFYFNKLISDQDDIMKKYNITGERYLEMGIITLLERFANMIDNSNDIKELEKMKLHINRIQTKIGFKKWISKKLIKKLYEVKANHIHRQDNQAQIQSQTDPI